MTTRNLLNFHHFRLSIWLAAAVSLTACSGIPYRIDIDQGNLISQQSLSQLSIGMSKNEVQYAIGTPLLNDIFHKNRWDYVQYYKNGRTQAVQEGDVSLYFTNGLLSKIDAESMTEIQAEPLPYGKQYEVEKEEETAVNEKIEE